MEKIKEAIRQNKIYLLVFTIIFFVGIFLRTYDFGGLLIFGFDQSRDAQLARNIIENRQPLPLLGPHAMGTRFKVGPAYYYFQYLSAKIFGDRPQSLAYPDLFFSIATIPLFFFFLRKYFNKELSLALTGLWSISFFAVKFSRFAWNPNSLPFFVLLLLYALLELADNQARTKKNAVLWVVIAGSALGIGMQLHTLSLLILPVAAAIFIWTRAGLKKERSRYLAVIFITALLLNVPQLVSEARTGGRNTRDFIIGVKEELKVHTSLSDDLFADISCHVQANSLIVSSYGDSQGCFFGDVAYKGEGALYYLTLLGKIAFAFIFSIAAYLALFHFWKKESDKNKKNFIQLVSIFLVVSFLMFFPMASSMMDRYYLVFAFAPIILLGLAYEYLKKMSRHAFGIGLAVFLILLVQNAITLKKYFTPFERVGLMEDSMLSENQALADFIANNVGPGKTAYIDQKQGDWRILNYFLYDKKISLMHAGKIDGSLDPAVPYFLITDGAHEKIAEQTEKNLPGYVPVKRASYGVFAITELSMQKK